MLFLIANGEPRPNILTEPKNESYHIRWARYCLGQCNNFYHNRYINKIKLNKSFFMGQQWILEEDTESFLKDDTNQARNRLTLTNNVITPIVNQYRGNASRMQINAQVKASSPMARNRRNDSLGEMLFKSRVANQPDNPYGKGMREKYPIGKTPIETEQIFDNMFVDTYVRDMNLLVKFISENNRLSAMQPRVAEEICYSGIGVIKGYEYSGNQVFRNIESENFFWDRSGMEYDLSDSAFMGDVYYLAPSEIFEKAPDLSAEEKKAIENYAIQYRSMGVVTGTTNSLNSQLNKYEVGGRVPVFDVYWRDGEEIEYGYVLDKFGYPYFTRINYVYEGEEKARYTDKDLIQVDSVWAKKYLKGKKKTKIFREIIHSCEIIPKEIMAQSSPDKDMRKFRDIALSWGPIPYQEVNSLDYVKAKFPYKAYCWGYVDGETMSPLDLAIHPQRFINRVLSITENQVNNSGGTNIFYDKSMVDPQTGESELLRNINQSKPVGMRANGRGMQNAVMPYDRNIKSGTMTLLEVTNIMKQYLQDTTGVNEAMQGGADNPDQLVGVTQLMIQRGSLVQEPFYNAIREVFLGCYQMMASVGKRIYADNERELSIAVGDSGAQVIRITKEMKNEEFSCFVKFSNPEEMLVDKANAELLNLRQLGLIDDPRVAELWGRSTPEDVASAVRAFSKEKIEMARINDEKQSENAKQMQDWQNQQLAAQKNEAFEQQARQDITELGDRKQRLNEIYAKALSKVAQNNPVAQKQIIGANTQLMRESVV